MLHGLGYDDLSRAEEIGECEDMVNEARGELALPLRDQYFVVPIRVTDNLASARIRFRSRPAATTRLEWRYL